MKLQDNSPQISSSGQSVAEASDSYPRDKGLVSILSGHSVDETVSKIEDILWSRGIRLFAVIDFTEEAHKARMAIPSTKLILFGHAGTVCSAIRIAPEAAIDMPLKLLVRQDDDGRVWISHNSPQYLGHRHGLPKDVTKNLAAAETVATRAAE